MESQNKHKAQVEKYKNLEQEHEVYRQKFQEEWAHYCKLK